jgi:3-oxoacyl-[acyl-carrier-protein] synthase II
VLFPRPQSPAAPPRVVITGAGLVTALGLGWRANAEGFRAGRAAFRAVTLFDVSRQRAKMAAEVDLPPASPVPGLFGRQLHRLDRAGQMLLLAVEEARAQAGWDRPAALPVVLGTTSGGMRLGEDYYRQAIQHPRQSRRQPTRSLYYLAETQARTVASAIGIRGPITIISNACASGANAIGHAWELLRRGHAERALAGGYDGLSLLTFAGFDSLQALSPTQCRPFDAGRDGLTLGEGAAVMTLETVESARRRGATILGELAGYGATIDLHHLTQPHPQGDAALDAMNLACASAGIAAADVDYVNAHGTGTSLNDSSEAIAIQRWAGDRVATLPVSSTKASIGHLLGAAGAVEAVVCLMALRERWLPPQRSTETIDSVCRFPLVWEPQDAPLKVAVSNSFGFGGANAALVLRRFE